MINIMPKEASDCKITWENAANCPAQDCTTGGKIAANGGIAKVTYIAEPSVLACGKMSLTVKRDGSTVCTGLTNVAPSLYYIKENIDDQTKCEVGTSALIKP